MPIPTQIARRSTDDNGSWVEPAFAEVHRVLKPDRFCISFYGWNHAETFLLAWKRAGLTPVGHFVWVKHYASKTGFTEARHEQAYLLAKGHPEKPADPPADVRQDWRYTGNRLHPTQKPVEALLPLRVSTSTPMILSMIRLGSVDLPVTIHPTRSAVVVSRHPPQQRLKASRSDQEASVP